MHNNAAKNEVRRRDGTMVTYFLPAVTFLRLSLKSTIPGHHVAFLRLFLEEFVVEIAFNVSVMWVCCDSYGIIGHVLSAYMTSMLLCLRPCLHKNVTDI